MDKKAELYKNAYEMELRTSTRMRDILNTAMQDVTVLYTDSEIEIERLFMESDALDDELME